MSPAPSYRRRGERRRCGVRAIFVTGTDTGVGKTVFTGCLARLLKERGYSVITQKWIETGCRSKVSKDVRMHLKIMGTRTADIGEYLKYCSPYLFRHSSSPHLAARLENRRIDERVIIGSFKRLSEIFDFVIVEGVGGALVPFNGKRLVIDIAKKLNLPVVVVVGNKLGAINHTLLTVEALKKRKMRILGVIFNDFKPADKSILRDNPRIVRALTGADIF